jgi:hypothetical protein
MNERIKELYTQVCMEQNLPFTLEHNSAYMLDAFADKFAELIVAECLKIAKTREDEFESADLLDESNAVGNVAYRISRQFGVTR